MFAVANTCIGECNMPEHLRSSLFFFFLFFFSIITQIYITKKTNTRLDDTYVGYSYICITDTIYI